MKKIVIGVIIGLLVLTGGTLIVLEKIGDMMINALIDSELQGLNDDLDNLLADPTPLPSDFNNTATPEAQPEATPEQSAVPQGTEASQPPSTPNASETGGKSSPTPSSKPGTTATPKPSPTATPITVTQIQSVKDEVTSADKVVAASMVMKKLSASDISTLQGMLSGGLSAEEKEKAKDIAYSRFTEEEIAKIKELYHKYMK